MKDTECKQQRWNDFEPSKVFLLRAWNEEEVISRTETPDRVSREQVRRPDH